MHQKTRKTEGRIRRHLTYANVMVTILAFVVFGTAASYAASQLGKNSVGPRQLRAGAVTTGKLANNAVNGTKVANGSLTGSDIDLKQLGTVPASETSATSGNAGTVGGHAAECSAGTTLIQGICFDSHSNPVAPNLEAATEDCASKGGYLPTPMELYSTKGILNLGNGTGPSQHQYTDDVYSKVGEGKYSTVVIDGTGSPVEQETNQASAYFCAYPLVR